MTLPDKPPPPTLPSEGLPEQGNPLKRLRPLPNYEVPAPQGPVTQPVS